VTGPGDETCYLAAFDSLDGDMHLAMLIVEEGLVIGDGS
jgi:hypothetical protein